MKKNFKLLLLTLIMGGGLFASEAMALDKVGDVYQIGTADDFEAFAKLINEGNSNPMKLNAVLTADIDLRSKGNCMIGTIGHTYGGEFDGQGHTITIDYKHDTSLDMDEGELGLIRRLRDGTVKNLLVNGNITTCNKCAGGIVSGIWYTGTIENCVSNVTITDSGSGDATHGGILARISNKSNITIKNCAFYGTIEASDREGSGGIIGWADYGNSENAETKIMNCVMGGTLHLKKNKDNDVFVRNNVSITNSYYVAQQDMNNTNNTSVSQKDLNALKNALGSDWSEIYNGAAPLPNQFVPTKNSDNYYELSTASHMRQFAELVNNSNGNVNGKMMNDINLSNIWTPIGQSDHHFTGHFDGQSHAIDYLDLSSNGGYDNQGLFGNISGNAVIENLTMGATCTIKGKENVAGFVGRASECTIKNCINKATIEASYRHASGIIATIDDPFTIINCINEGHIKGGIAAGILSRDWNRTTNSTISNCSNKGRIEGSGDEIGGVVAAINNTINITNCSNSGEVSGGERIGGILGATWLTSPSVSITNCTNKGTITGSRFIGGILGRNEDTMSIQNCGNEGNISSNGDYSEGTNAGGIVGCSVNTISILNCYNIATITGKKENAGICAWMGSSESTIKNCFSNGNVKNTVADTDANNPSKPLWRKSDLSSDNTTNNYYLYEIINHEGSPVEGNQGKQITENQLTSGELCYKLNGESSVNPDWHQTIGTDNYPVPFTPGHRVVYKNSYNDADLYANISSDSQDGYFEIANADDLEAFAYTVNSGHTTVNGKLTDDIDMDGYNNFPGIGTSTNRFNGIFDGQRHIISNLDMNISEDGVGFFRYVTGGTNGTTIKRFTIDSSCSFKGHDGVGAFVGRAQGEGNLLLEELGNEANVIGNKNAAGILGVDWENNVSIIMNNCYNTARIESTATQNPDGGALSGWMGSKARVTNCYNIGEIVGGDNFARGTQIKVKNCYATYTDWPAADIDNESFDAISPTSDYKFSDGTVFAALFNGVDGSVWRMYFDTENATKSHPVLYGNKIAMNENCKNRMVEDGTYDVTMFRTVKTGGWNTVCLPFNMDAEAIKNYFGTDTKVAMLDNNKDGSDNVLHFKTVTEITAGQAYLVYPGVDADFSNKEITGVEIAATAPLDGITQAGFTFQGVFEPTTLIANTDRIVSGGTSIVKTSGGTLKGFRAYFHPENANAPAPSRFVIDDDETTGIITPEGEVIVDAPVYNLGGQRVNKPQRGLYIVNGKKYVK